MSVVEATERGQINFSLEKRPTLAHKIEEAAQRLGTTPSALCRDVVETFLDAHIEWTERANEDRRRALQAINQAARTTLPLGRITSGDDSSR